MTKLFTVALCDAQDLPTGQRIAAEIRYIKTLEGLLGGHEGAAQIYRAWINANETSAEEVDKDTVRLAVRWPIAAEQAQEAGLRPLGDLGGDAHFDVRLERQPA